MSDKGISISLGPLLMRHIKGVQRVSSIVETQAVPLAQFAERCRKLKEQAAAASDSLLKVADVIWNTEGLSITYGKFGLPDNTLNDPRIPRETLGIVHVGYGIAVAEHTRFDVGKLKEIVGRNCEPNYAGFAWEGIGSGLRVYEPGFFRVVNRMLGVVPNGAPTSPDKTGFFAKFLSEFPPETQRHLTHGYGRLMGFSTMSIHGTLRGSSALPPERRLPYVQGMAVAYGMLNCAELPRILNSSGVVSPEPVRAAFQNGLVWVLAYCDWFAPGLLKAWRAQGKTEEALVERARAESAANIKRGYPLCGGLENPLAA